MLKKCLMNQYPLFGFISWKVRWKSAPFPSRKYKVTISGSEVAVKLDALSNKMKSRKRWKFPYHKTYITIIRCWRCLQ
jgi:hypothetical protein